MNIKTGNHSAPLADNKDDFSTFHLVYPARSAVSIAALSTVSQ